MAALEGPYARQIWHLVDVDGRDRDYKIEKRLLEHVVFREAASRGAWRSRVGTMALRECIDNILNPAYVLNGLDLTSGQSGETRPIPSEAKRASQREPNLDFARAYANYPSPWINCADDLATLMPEPRATIVDAAAAAIASSHLQVEVAALDADRDPGRHFAEMDQLLCKRDPDWPRRFKALAEFAKDEIAGQDPEQAVARLEHLSSALRRSERVQFIHGSVGVDTQQRAVDGFNTPLYPEVLIATGVLGEGLDLHRFCRRVIHHDLPWNPANLSSGPDASTGLEVWQNAWRPRMEPPPPGRSRSGCPI